MAKLLLFLSAGLCVALVAPTLAASGPSPDGKHKMAPMTDKGSEEDSHPNMDALMEECNKTFPTPMHFLEELNSTGSFTDEKDQTPMCYLHCIFEKSGLVDQKGMFDAMKAKAMYKMGVHDEGRLAQLDDMVATCILQRDEAENCHRVYGFVKCLMSETIKKPESQSVTVSPDKVPMNMQTELPSANVNKTSLGSSKRSEDAKNKSSEINPRIKNQNTTVFKNENTTIEPRQNSTDKVTTHSTRTTSEVRVQKNVTSGSSGNTSNRNSKGVNERDVYGSLMPTEGYVVTESSPAILKRKIQNFFRRT